MRTKSRVAVRLFPEARAAALPVVAARVVQVATDNVVALGQAGRKVLPKVA